MKRIFKMRRLWLLLSYPVAAALLYFASLHENFAEWYAGTIYPVLSRAGNRLTGIAPFSVGEILVVLFLILMPAAFIRLLVRLIRHRGRRGETAAVFCVNLACFTGIVFFLFTVNCGTNYYRSTFAQLSGFAIRPSGRAELVRLCQSLAADSNRLRAKEKTDGQSVMELRAPDFPQNADKARKALDLLEKDFPSLRSGYGGPKPVAASKLMSYGQITGMFFPFTFEANVNTDAPDYTIPFTMCHELSHLRGFMREDEANFISYLACSASPDGDFRYSGAAMAFTYASNALYSIDGKTANTVFSLLSEGVRRDLAANNAYWNRFKGPVARAAGSVNNHYLKANDQKDGVQSYGRMVDLLLALQRSREKGTSK